MPDIFAKRVAFKPFEYPELMPYKDAINHSYWLVSEWNFLGDIHEYHTRLLPWEQNVIRNTLLAISQVEVSVKRFWTNLGQRFPKAEFEQVGITFGESEVRHADAYSHLLQVLSLNEDFAAVMEVPAIKRRVEYLQSFVSGACTTTNRGYAMVLCLFSAFVENVSLFSQFAIIKSFNKHLCLLKDIDNVVSATQKEEQVHAMLGTWIINQIREEHPDWFDDYFYKTLEEACIRAYFAECDIIDWIFEKGELPFIKKATLKEFIKKRLNDSIAGIGGKPEFLTVDRSLLSELEWFEHELYAEVAVDFFHKRAVTYTKNDKPINAGELF